MVGKLKLTLGRQASKLKPEHQLLFANLFNDPETRGLRIQQKRRPVKATYFATSNEGEEDHAWRR
jgi:hypothetical protein